MERQDLRGDRGAAGEAARLRPLPLGARGASAGELRFWRDGVIPDLAEAVDSPRHLTGEVETGRRLLALASSVPTPVWGRDQLRAGEMWNSNSVIAWLVASSGLDAGKIYPPQGGRAPGWDAGLVVARRG